MHKQAFLLVVVLALSVTGPTPATAEGTAYRGPYLTGRLLVAAETMPDPRFRQSVILILEHDRSGAFGVILNQIIGAGSLEHLMSGFGMTPDVVDEAALSREVSLHNGGPVEQDRAVVVHSADYDASGSQSVGNGLAWTLESSILNAAAAGHGPEKMRVFIGYAGWGAGQLEKEINRDDWLDADAHTGLVFDTPSDDLYDAVQDSVGLTL